MRVRVVLGAHKLIIHSSRPGCFATGLTVCGNHERSNILGLFFEEKIIGLTSIYLIE